MVDLKGLLGILAENTLKTGYPVPIPREEVYEWAEPLGLSRKGSTYLYTGALYQLIPYIESMVEFIKAVEGKPKVSGLLFKASRILTLAPEAARAILRPKADLKDYTVKVLRAIARLLDNAGLSYAYLYEDDLYSGVLLYDLGLEEEFATHAKRVHERLVGRGASTVITVDPHTTYILREVYPKFIDGFDLEVVSYIEALYESGWPQSSGVNSGEENGLPVVIHDPCYYARYLNMIEQPRDLLRRAGYKLVEPRRSRELTYCCGGPLESISPKLSLRIAETRLKELAEKASRVVTLCPLCYVNLERARSSGILIDDIALYLMRALGSPS